MAEPGEIVARIRARGANIKINDGKLRIINRSKLTEEAVAFVRAHAKVIAAFLADEQIAVDERAAIIEFEGKTPREWAHQFADILIRTRPAGVSDLDWSWFITRCGQIIDEAPAPEGASW